MYPVIVWDASPADAVEFRNQLVRAGLVMNQDFVWSYIPLTWDNFSGDAVTRKCVVFEFAEPEMATFYQLKWGTHT